ncbi:hypothetical protein BA190_10325 [Labrys sp. WJW]|nr:hypothetical protein BA190_10325 [Labrys sp. WJW]
MRLPWADGYGFNEHPEEIAQVGRDIAEAAAQDDVQHFQILMEGLHGGRVKLDHLGLFADRGEFGLIPISIGS